jgi:hypothetical protein
MKWPWPMATVIRPHVTKLAWINVEFLPAFVAPDPRTFYGGTLRSSSSLNGLSIFSFLLSPR